MRAPLRVRSEAASACRSCAGSPTRTAPRSSSTKAPTDGALPCACAFPPCAPSANTLHGFCPSTDVERQQHERSSHLARAALCAAPVVPLPPSRELPLPPRRARSRTALRTRRPSRSPQAQPTRGFGVPDVRLGHATLARKRRPRKAHRSTPTAPGARSPARRRAAMYRISAREVDALPMRQPAALPGRRRRRPLPQPRSTASKCFASRSTCWSTSAASSSRSAASRWARRAASAHSTASSVARDDAIARGARRARLRAPTSRASACAHARRRRLRVVDDRPARSALTARRSPRRCARSACGSACRATLVPAWYVEVQVTRRARRATSTPTRTSCRPSTARSCSATTSWPTSRSSIACTPRATPPFLPLPGPGGRGGFPHPTRHARRLPAAVRDRQPRHARERAVLAQRPVARRAAPTARTATTSRRSPTCWRPTASARPAPTSATSRCRSTATCTRASRRPTRSTTRYNHGLPPEREPHAGRRGGDQPLLHHQLPARLVLRRGLRRGRRQRADQQLRPRRPRRRQHRRRGAGLHRHQQREHVHAARTASGRACACTCGRAACRWSRSNRAGRDRRRQDSRRRRSSVPRRSTSPATSSLALDAANADGSDRHRRVHRVHQRGRRRRQDRRHRPRHLPVRRQGQERAGRGRDRRASSSTTWRPARIGMSGDDPTHHDSRASSITQADGNAIKARARAGRARDAAHGPPGARCRATARSTTRWSPTSGATTCRNRLVNNANGLVRQPGARHGRRLVRLRVAPAVREGRGPRRCPPTRTSAAPTP